MSAVAVGPEAHARAQPFEVVEAVETGCTLEARELIFEYMAATCAEVGWPVPRTPAELPEVLRADVNDVADAYRMPGCFLLARGTEGDRPVLGGVGLQVRDKATAEVKRLYVRPTDRGRGVAGALMAGVHDRARRAGFERLVLDVLPSRVRVLDWYRTLGYAETEPYTEEPVPMAFLSLDLSEQW